MANVAQKKPFATIFEDNKRQITMSPKDKSFCIKTVKALLKNNYAYFFINPVDPVQLGIPDYFDIIKNPMDLSTVQKKLNNDEYHTMEECFNDINLIFQNCHLYNNPGDPVCCEARILENVFTELLTKAPIANEATQRSQARKAPAKTVLPPLPTPVSSNNSYNDDEDHYDDLDSQTEARDHQESSRPEDMIDVFFDNGELSEVEEEEIEEENEEEEEFLPHENHNKKKEHTVISESDHNYRQQQQRSNHVVIKLKNEPQNRNIEDRLLDYKENIEKENQEKEKEFKKEQRLSDQEEEEEEILPISKKQVQHLSDHKEKEDAILSTKKYDHIEKKKVMPGEQRKRCEAIIKELKKSKYRDLTMAFKEPVDALLWGATDYYDIVKHPMDMSTYEKKYKDNQYENEDELAADIQLMFNNCYLYNPPTNGVYKTGKKLENIFKKCWNELHEKTAVMEKPKKKLESKDTNKINNNNTSNPETPTILRLKLSVTPQKEQNNNNSNNNTNGKGHEKHSENDRKLSSNIKKLKSNTKSSNHRSPIDLKLTISTPPPVKNNGHQRSSSNSSCLSPDYKLAISATPPTTTTSKFHDYHSRSLSSSVTAPPKPTSSTSLKLVIPTPPHAKHNDHRRSSSSSSSSYSSTDFKLAISATSPNSIQPSKSKLHDNHCRLSTPSSHSATDLNRANRSAAQSPKHNHDGNHRLPASSHSSDVNTKKKRDDPLRGHDEWMARAAKKIRSNSPAIPPTLTPTSRPPPPARTNHSGHPDSGNSKLGIKDQRKDGNQSMNTKKATHNGYQPTFLYDIIDKLEEETKARKEEILRENEIRDKMEEMERKRKRKFTQEMKEKRERDNKERLAELSKSNIDICQQKTTMNPFESTHLRQDSDFHEILKYNYHTNDYRHIIIPRFVQNSPMTLDALKTQLLSKSIRLMNNSVDPVDPVDDDSDMDID